MIIQDSAVQLSSQHQSIEVSQTRESLRYWKTANGREPEAGKNQKAETNGINVSLSVEAVEVSLSQEAQKISAAKDIENLEEKELMLNLNMRILREMIERLTGRRVKVSQLNHVHGNRQLSEEAQKKVPDSETGNAGFGLEYTRHQSHYESERAYFEANGTIMTQDGVEVEFAVNLAMERVFYTQENVEIRMGEALKDPLVINFEGSAAQLTKTKFDFDIDSDGEDDLISFVSPDSGFLALDRDGDGFITDGSELFGAVSGDGFTELAEYDEDGNNWIDENDSVFQRLQIWTKDEVGNDTLFSLGQKGVGAIYLQSVGTPFSLKNDVNDLMGQVKSSGIYITEDYTPKTIQQLDLVT